MVTHKLMRALCYGKELAMMLLCRAAAPLCRRFFSACRDLWLASERGNDARDNGYWLYRYLRTQHPDINVRYIITADSPDYDRVAAWGVPIRQGSFLHYVLYYCADYLISTHVQPCAPDRMAHYHLAANGLRASGKQVFLQHGITKDEMQWLHRKNLFLDLFVCGALPEYNYLQQTFGHPEGVVQYLGFARFDRLFHAPAPKQMVLLMPTWRGAQYPRGKAFRQTAYYHQFQSLLQSPALNHLLERYNFQLIFYPHVEMQPELSAFAAESDRVILADRSTHDVQQLLMDCALLITDYSSVFFDIGYMNKPVLYYQFDEAEFRHYHYQKGYFDYHRDGFGPVCTEEAELLQALEQYFTHSMHLQPLYQQRIDKYFPLRDDHNCQRIFEAIRAL